MAVINSSIVLKKIIFGILISKLIYHIIIFGDSVSTLHMLKSLSVFFHLSNKYTRLDRFSLCSPYNYYNNFHSSMSTMPRFLGQQEAIKIDEELFNEYKFSVDQLMELAGLSVASTIANVYSSKKAEKVVIVCGPGNNGGDGMVAARHLKIFGFSNVTLLNARKPTKDLFINLILQAELNNVNISYDPSPVLNDPSIGLIVDALFGFSFKPPVRPDFEPLMEILTKGYKNNIPIVSVDIPSGWDVEKGPSENQSLYFMPDTLVSLTAPKLCAKYFNGCNHYLGGRFVPKRLEEKYAMNLPEYPSTDCIVRL